MWGQLTTLLNSVSQWPWLCEEYYINYSLLFPSSLLHLPPSSLPLTFLLSALSTILLYLSFLLFPSVHGVVDLVRLPYNQYQEDGRIMWGLQQGASSFSTSAGVAVVELTSRTLETLQVWVLTFFKGTAYTSLSYSSVNEQ